MTPTDGAEPGDAVESHAAAVCSRTDFDGIMSVLRREDSHFRQTSKSLLFGFGEFVESRQTQSVPEARARGEVGRRRKRDKGLQNFSF